MEIIMTVRCGGLHLDNPGVLLGTSTRNGDRSDGAQALQRRFELATECQYLVRLSGRQTCPVKGKAGTHAIIIYSETFAIQRAQIRRPFATTEEHLLFIQRTIEHRIDVRRTGQQRVCHIVAQALNNGGIFGGDGCIGIARRQRIEGISAVLVGIHQNDAPRAGSCAFSGDNYILNGTQCFQSVLNGPALIQQRRCTSQIHINISGGFAVIGKPDGLCLIGNIKQIIGR